MKAADVAASDPVVPLLKTKLEAPASPRLVVRETLTRELSSGVSLPLTLVYGPAGSGKTMLVTQWLASAPDGLPVAWLSLDAGDNDPARFWMYIVGALRSVLPGFGDTALAMLRTPGADLVDEALLEIVNDLVDGTRQSVLILDDYHAIHDERIHSGMTSLLEHLPNTLRIVITSRAEPPLRIGTLRARGQLTELDASRLRFSPPEAASLLNEVHGLGLDADTVAQLHRRTEGWAAGLYLGVLSLRGREDASAFIDSFAGSDRRVVDYLGAEVLADLPGDELDFLLDTAVLDRFCASLCEAVTGTEDARATLDRLERSNYFLIPLDSSHDWYRYHHLFGDLLRHELERRRPDSLAELNHRAGRWFLEAGLVSEAIGHLTAAGDLDEVSELIATHWLSFTNVGQRATVARWLEALPADHLLSDARMCLAEARTASITGDHDEILEWLDRAERAPRFNPSEDAARGEQVTVFRSMAWELLGDMQRAKQLSLRLAPLDGSSFWHGLAACNLGSAAYWLDDSAEAGARFDAALELNHDRIAMVSLAATGQLAVIAADEGDWRSCAAHVRAGSELARAGGLEEYRQCSLVHVARGRLLAHERNPSDARAELERALTLARRGLGLVALAYVLVTLAGLLQDAGERRAARELVLEARDLVSRAPEPGTRIARLLARAEGRLRLIFHPRVPRSVEELTPREEAVLRLFPSGLSAREIGGELGISHDTIKTHTQSIYRKLGATSRREAVARARELELL